MRQLPSDKYFDQVVTQKQYFDFIKSGMCWELEPLFPSSWEQHLLMKELWLRHKEYDGN